MHRTQCRNWCVGALIVALIVWVPFAIVTGMVAGFVLLLICGVVVVAEQVTQNRTSKNRRRKVVYCYTSSDLLEVLDDKEWMTEKEIRVAMWQRAKSLGLIHPKWGKAPSHPLVWNLLVHNVEATRYVRAERRALGNDSAVDGGLWRYRRDRYPLPSRSQFPCIANSVRPS